MRIALPLALAALLTGCGADGPPDPPATGTPPATQGGASLEMNGTITLDYRL